MSHQYVSSLTFEGNKTQIDSVWKDCIEYRDVHIIPFNLDFKYALYDCHITRVSDSEVTMVIVSPDTELIFSAIDIFTEKHTEVFIDSYFYDWGQSKYALNVKHYQGKELYVNKESGRCHNEFYNFQHKESIKGNEVVITTDEVYNEQYLNNQAA